MSEENGDLGPQEYLGYRLIVKIKERTQRQISRSKFLKLNCVADRFLRDELNTDIGLPRYWYKYGEILDEQSINGEFYHAPSARGYSGQQYLTSREYEDEEFDVNEQTRNNIDDAVEWTALRFAKRNAEQIKNYQYQVQSPKEFIRAYSELRERLDVSNIEEQAVLAEFDSTRGEHEQLALDLLDEMLLTYPKNEYDTIYDLYLRWDDTARLLVEASDFDELNEFLDEFIEALSKAELRFEHCNHIPEDRMDRWREERGDAVNDFDQSLIERRRELLRKRDPSGELDKVAEEYNETVGEMMPARNDGE